MDGTTHQRLPIDRRNQTSETSAYYTDLTKKRKLYNELNDSCSPLSKQKLHNQPLMEEDEEEEDEEEEEEDSSENKSSFLKSEVTNSSMDQESPSTSSSSSATNEISSNHIGSITSGIDDDYQLKNNSYNELGGFGDPIMAELIMKNGMEESDEDQSDPFLYSNAFNDFGIATIKQDGKEREATIDQEFEQYFAGLMI